jgi:hypothetical protein
MPACVGCAGVAKVKTLEDRLRGPIEPWRLELIARYSESVARHAYHIAHEYPGYDVEVRMMQALYLAALTYRPGRQVFYRWFLSKWKTQLHPINCQIRNRARGLRAPWKGAVAGDPVRIRYIDNDAYDLRMSYRDPEIEMDFR